MDRRCTLSKPVIPRLLRSCFSTVGRSRGDHGPRSCNWQDRGYVDAYRSDSALTAGFNWYRAFSRPADDNRALASRIVAKTLLYVRGELESGDINDYVEVLRSAGISRLEDALVPGAGHFTQEEAPGEAWRLIAGFIGPCSSRFREGVAPSIAPSLGQRVHEEAHSDCKQPRVLAQADSLRGRPDAALLAHPGRPPVKADQRAGKAR